MGGASKLSGVASSRLLPRCAGRQPATDRERGWAATNACGSSRVWERGERREREREKEREKEERRRVAEGGKGGRERESELLEKRERPQREEEGREDDG